jgi:hypothetical protein
LHAHDVGPTPEDWNRLIEEKVELSDFK